MKNIIKILSIVMILVLIVSPMIIATTTANPQAGTGVIGTNITETGSNRNVVGKQIVTNAWGVIQLILQVAAIGALIFSGVRYMFASADQKADIKKGMGALAIGAILVFGSTLVINMLIKIVGDLAKT